MTILAKPAFESKLCSIADLPSKLSNLARPIVFTNGVFDILHRGHASYLDQARSLGGSLVVGINTDASVKMLAKGEDRPINTEADRQALIAALASVDLVVLFAEKTPIQLIAAIRPDIYVKGGDYDIDALEETRLVKSWGGVAVAIPFIYERSTTSLLGRIRG